MSHLAPWPDARPRPILLRPMVVPWQGHGQRRTLHSIEQFAA